MLGQALEPDAARLQPLDDRQQLDERDKALARSRRWAATPETFSTKTTLQPARLSALTCKSRFCSMVETRANPMLATWGLLRRCPETPV